MMEEVIGANKLAVYLISVLPCGYSRVVKRDGCELSSTVPNSRLLSFLNDHVAGSVVRFSFVGETEDVLLQLRDGVSSERFHRSNVTFVDFFHQLPWASIQRVFDGQMMHVRGFTFYHLQLPTDADPNAFLRLPAIR